MFSMALASLLVSSIEQKLLDSFSQNVVERCHVGRKKLVDFGHNPVR